MAIARERYCGAEHAEEVGPQHRHPAQQRVGAGEEGNGAPHQRGHHGAGLELDPPAGEQRLHGRHGQTPHGPVAGVVAAQVVPHHGPAGSQHATDLGGHGGGQAGVEDRAEHGERDDQVHGGGGEGEGGPVGGHHRQLRVAPDRGDQPRLEQVHARHGRARRQRGRQRGEGIAVARAQIDDPDGAAAAHQLTNGVVGAAAPLVEDGAVPGLVRVPPLGRTPVAGVALVDLADAPHFVRVGHDPTVASPVVTTADSEVPFVSVVMPVRNERGFIETLMGEVLDQDYPADRLEVLVADGGSDDGTREWLDAMAATEPRVTVLDNPERIVPTGLNRAVARTRGDVVVRIDGHARIAPDFLRSSVDVLAEHPEAWCVGGPMVHRGRGAFGRATAWAMSSRAGVGGASHRFEGHEGPGESVQFPAYRRWVFDEVGDFDEQLVRNQDDEFAFRLRQAGGTIWISPRIRYEYYVRERPAQLWRQYRQYSFWRIPMLRKHRRPTTARQLAPPAFFAVMAGGVVAGAWRRSPALALALPAGYLAALVAVGVRSRRDLDGAAALRVPLAVATLHGAYAAGWASGAWCLVARPDAWTASSAMAELSR